MSHELGRLKRSCAKEKIFIPLNLPPISDDNIMRGEWRTTVPAQQRRLHIHIHKYNDIVCGDATTPRFLLNIHLLQRLHLAHFNVSTVIPDNVLLFAYECRPWSLLLAFIIFSFSLFFSFNFSFYFNQSLTYVVLIEVIVV